MVLRLTLCGASLGANGRSYATTAVPAGWLVMGLGIAGQLWQLQAELPTHHQMDTHYRAMVYGQVLLRCCWE